MIKSRRTGFSDSSGVFVTIWLLFSMRSKLKEGTNAESYKQVASMLDVLNGTT